MKTIFLVLIFSALIFSQTKVTYTSTLDSGDVAGTEVDLAKGLMLGGITVPDSLSDSLSFQFYDGTAWNDIVSTDSTIYYVTPRIEKQSSMAIDPRKVFPFNIVRPVVSDTARETKTIKIIGVQF